MSSSFAVLAVNPSTLSVKEVVDMVLNTPVPTARIKTAQNLGAMFRELTTLLDRPEINWGKNEAGLKLKVNLGEIDQFPDFSFKGVMVDMQIDMAPRLALWVYGIRNASTMEWVMRNAYPLGHALEEQWDRLGGLDTHRDGTQERTNCLGWHLYTLNLTWLIYDQASVRGLIPANLEAEFKEKCKELAANART